jgi:hypothetical protein
MSGTAVVRATMLLATVVWALDAWTHRAPQASIEKRR